MTEKSSGAGRPHDGSPRSRPRTAWAVLAFIAAAGALAGGYAWYALKRIDYFIARDIRGLSTLASQIGRIPSSTLAAATPGSPGEKELEAVVRPLFAQSFLSVFDVVLLAGPKGEVIYQTVTTQPPPLPTMFAPKDLEESRPLPPTGIITNLGSLEKQHHSNSPEPLKMERLLAASGWVVIRLMDQEYYLFTHPVRGPDHLLVGALVPKKKLQLQAVSISNSTLSIVLAVVVLLLCWYPYIRILSLPAGAPLKPVGVVLAAVAALGGSAVMTVLLADTVVFRHLSKAEDIQLAVYGQKLRDDIQRDILRSVVLAEGLRQWTVQSVLTRNPPPQRIDDLEKNEVDWSIPAIWQQPYFYGLVWLDRSGTPVVTAVSKGIAPQPPPSMSDRAFFKDAMLGRWQTIRERPTRLTLPMVDHRYIVEIRHGASDTEITISVPDDRGVIGVHVPFIHFVDPVVPPGLGFAVIDENGTVVFHSEKQRALNENFFKETDDNRHLRAAMYTRRDAKVNGRYWGVDHQLYVAPIPGTPWTAVAMRDESLLRTINTEAIVLTALLLALYAASYACIFVGLAIFRPTYRAPWLWPEEEREPEYDKAILALLLESLAFFACIVAMGSSQVIYIAFVASLRGLSTAFVVINGTTRDWRWRCGAGGSILVTAVWIYLVLTGNVDPIVQDRLGSAVLPWVLSILAALPLVLSLLPGWRAKAQPANPVQLLRKYQFVGLGMILVAAVLPTIAFLNTAIRLGVDAQVKYIQLRLADLLERRISLLERINMRGARIAWDAYTIEHVLNSAWTLNPRADTPRPWAPGDTAPRAREEMQVGRWWSESELEPPAIPPMIQDLLPRYSDSSIAVRELHFDDTSDRTWRWFRRSRDLTLERPIVLDEPTRKRFYTKDERGLPTTARLLIRSSIPAATLQDFFFPQDYVPGSFAKELQCPANLRDSDTGVPSGTQNVRPRPDHFQLVTLILVLVTLLTGWVLYQAVGFMGYRVFLFDVEELTVWTDGKIVDVPKLNLFVETGAEGSGPVDRTSFHEIDIASAITSQTPWRDLLTTADQANQKGILIVGFESAFQSDRFSAPLLSLLEELIRMNRHSIVIVSKLSIPAALATQSGSIHERWQAVLDEFAHVNHPFPSDSFERIWSNTSHAERLMLFQIARDGLANRKSGHVLKRLFARDLIRFAPELALHAHEKRYSLGSKPSTRTDHFEEFVQRAARREGLSDEESSPTPPRWQPLKVSMAILAIAALVLFLATQKELMNSTSVVITAFAAGIPAILKLVAIVSGRPSRDPEFPNS